MVDQERKAERKKLLWVLYHELSERQRDLYREARLVQAVTELFLDGQALEGYGNEAGTFCSYCFAYLTLEESEKYSLRYEHTPDCILMELKALLEDYDRELGHEGRLERDISTGRGSFGRVVYQPPHAFFEDGRA